MRIIKITILIICNLILSLSLFSQSNRNISNAEYFWDTDPGVGNAISLSAFDGSFDQMIEHIFSVDTLNFPAYGAHVFNLRVQDEDGSWSLPFKRVIDLTEPLQTRNLNITEAEYFWDTDPGEGNATTLIAYNGAYNEALEEAFSDYFPPLNGIHTLGIRVKDVNGLWSPVYKRVVVLEDQAIQRNFNIVSAEYFWNADPGTGSGIPLLAFDGNFNSSIEELFLTPLSFPAYGAHIFNLRVQDEDGSWSLPFKRVIDLTEPLQTRNFNITEAEYFWDIDPGEGNATTLIAYNGAYDEALELAFSSSLTPLCGIHTLALRVKDVNGLWSPVYKRVISFEINDGYSNCSDTIGCMDSVAINYNSFAIIDDGSCTYPIQGCTDLLALNYDSLATINDSSCVYGVFGCIDSLASNYNPFATIDNGTCLYSSFVFGCTDTSALNYDPLASVDDSSCCYNSSQTVNTIGNAFQGYPFGSNVGWENNVCISGDLSLIHI